MADSTKTYIHECTQCNNQFKEGSYKYSDLWSVFILGLSFAVINLGIALSVAAFPIGIIIGFPILLVGIVGTCISIYRLTVNDAPVCPFCGSKHILKYRAEYFKPGTADPSYTLYKRY